jgi:4-oxalocrotonate tautomerase
MPERAPVAGKSSAVAHRCNVAAAAHPAGIGPCTARGSCASMRAVKPQEELMPEVVFYALGGRSVEQKRALVKDFTDAVVKNYKVDPSAVTITIVESPKEDKAKGGVLFSDMGAPKT